MRAALLALLLAFAALPAASASGEPSDASCDSTSPLACVVDSAIPGCGALPVDVYDRGGQTFVCVLGVTIPIL